jgi:proteasome lid subunit RPN8/RPN11
MKITDALLKQIYTHAESTYPFECCGFLLGSFGDGGLVLGVRQATNQSPNRTKRFLISEKEFGQAQLDAEEIGLDVIGFYHSHPDWPPIPSQTDMNNAAWDYYYLITSIHDRKPLNTNVWQIADEGLRRFVGVPLEIVDEAELSKDDAQ